MDEVLIPQPPVYYVSTKRFPFYNSFVARLMKLKGIGIAYSFFVLLIRSLWFEVRRLPLIKHS